MFLHSGIEIVLAGFTLLAANLFWEFPKRARYLKWVIHDEPFLDAFISRQTLGSASPMVAPLAVRNEIGWFLNIKCIMDADRLSQRRVRAFVALVLAAIFTASSFVGTTYLAINVLIFFICTFGSISQPARNNALQHVLAMAVVLDKWRSENVSECEEWVEQASSLRPLYNAVKNARS